MEKTLKGLFTAVLEGERLSVRNEVRAAIKAHLEPQAILHVMQSAMQKVGTRFEKGEYFVPEMLIAARAMQEGMDLLRPYLIDQKVQPAGIIVIATVKGDLHDIGKNLVAIMLEGVGFKVIDLGVDVSGEQVIQAIERYHPHIVALSALLTTTMPGLKKIIETIDRAGLHPHIKVMVGGAPVTEAYAKKIGADGYAPDAALAIDLARRLMA
jgi:5-methyltetrahydrofolate--homocysteine methyltransferase